MYNDDEIERMLAEDEARQEAEALKPKFLFKYKPIANCVDLERVCDILQKNTIYMPNIGELNDPLEGTNSIMINGNYSGRDKVLMQQRVLSLSESCFLSALWAHYASNYSGVCLGYRREGTFAEAAKIEYVDKQTSWSSAPSVSVPFDLFKKSNEWEYEQEWRLIYSTENESEQTFLKYKQKELVCVLFGCKMTKFIQDIVKKYIASTVAFYTVHPDNQKHCLYAESDKGCKKIYSIDDLDNDLSIK